MGLPFPAVKNIAKWNSGCFIGLLLALVHAASAGCDDGGEAQENRISFDTFFSGSCMDSSIDTNGDGINALILRAKGAIPDLGPINFSEEVETQLKDPAVPCITADGIPGNVYELIQGRISLQVEESGDIITGALISDNQCIPVDTGEDAAIDFEGQWTVTGGTGKYVKAAGIVNFSGNAKILLSHASGRFIIVGSQHTGVIEFK